MKTDPQQKLLPLCLDGLECITNFPVIFTKKMGLKGTYPAVQNKNSRHSKHSTLESDGNLQDLLDLNSVNAAL